MAFTIGILFIVIVGIHTESFPYRPKVYLRNCTEGYSSEQCKVDCISVNYVWGACVQVPKVAKFWYPICSCFTVSFHKLEVDYSFDI